MRAARDIGWIAALGFENPYALRMRAAHARELRVERPPQPGCIRVDSHLLRPDREFMEARPQ